MVSSPFSDVTVGIDTIIQLPGTVMLPPVRSEAFMSQRHEVNPALALNLLNDIQSKVLRWQDQLRKIVQALNALHAQGPMVEGWIESSVADADATGMGQDANATLLRHGDTDALLQYIDSLDNTSVSPAAPVGPISSPSANHSAANPRGNVSANPKSSTEYRLCKLDANGRVQSQPCPAEQMGVVSIAIARYQKFKQLLEQKEVIDAKLKQAVEQLTQVRSSL